MTQSKNPGNVMPSTYYCPECLKYSGVSDPISNETICEKCGLVLDDTNIKNCERPMFNQRQIRTRKRTGPPSSPLYLNKSTVFKKRDIFTLINSKSQQRKFSRLYKRNLYLNSQNRSLKNGLDEFKGIMNHFQIPKPIRLRVFTLVKQAQARSLLQGRAYHTIIPSLLYLVCQERNFPLRLRKITSELDIPNHIFFKYIRVMAAELKISNNKHKQNIHVTKTCDELNILFLEREVALLLQKIPFYIKNGKKPSGILGGVIYYFSQKKHLGITYQQISNIVKVTEPCIRARFREIRKWIQQIKEGNNQK